MLYLKLNNGVEIPQLGLGVFQTKPGEETVNAVKWALEAGYRHIDTAKMYNNEESVAEGIKAAGLKREDVFITSKILPADIIAGKTAEGFDETLHRLRGSDASPFPDAGRNEHRSMEDHGSILQSRQGKSDRHFQL